MPRPKTKEELLDLSEANYQKLMSLVASYSEAEQEREFPEGTLNRNIRDVLAHLHHWHLLFLGWYEEGMMGKKPDMPAKGYTWRTTSELNHSIQKLYRNTPLAEVKQMFQESYTLLASIIKRHNQEELFTKKCYPWTGSTSLAAYLISATSSHYDWAYKLIRKCKKKQPTS